MRRQASYNSMSEEPTLRFNKPKDMKLAKPKIMNNIMIPQVFRQSSKMSKHESKQEWHEYNTK